MFRLLVILFIFSILSSSCIIKKRLHQDGWYVHRIRSGKKYKASDSTISQYRHVSNQVKLEEDSLVNNYGEVDTSKINIYKNINLFRQQLGLGELEVDESLELASAQHGCWLALYNFRLDSTKIVLQSNETSLYLAKKLNDPVDRIRQYATRPLSIVVEHLQYYYHNPDESEILNYIKTRCISSRYKYCGYWVIKYETKKFIPIWYLVFLLTD